MSLFFPGVTQQGKPVNQRLAVIQEHNLDPEETTFGDYLKKFSDLEATFPGNDTLSVYDDEANLAFISVFDVDLALNMYDRMYCDSDRKNVRPVLKTLLHSSAVRIEHAAMRVSVRGILAKTPGDVELATRFHDDLIAAKTKLDKISNSL